MITQELLDYIKGRLDAGESQDSISQSLASTGWQADAIAEAWNKLQPQSSAIENAPNSAPEASAMPVLESMPVLEAMPNVDTKMPENHSNLHLRLLILIGVLALILAGGAYFYWQSQSTAEESAQSDAAQSEESPLQELPQGIEAMSPMEDPTLLEELPQVETPLEDPALEEMLIEEEIQTETAPSSGPKPKVKVQAIPADESL